MESDEYTEELHSHYCDGEFLGRLRSDQDTRRS